MTTRTAHDMDDFFGTLEMIFGDNDDWAATEDKGHKVKTPTKVFRVEMPNGRGPYNSGLPNASEIYAKICDPTPGFDCSRLAQANHENINFTGRAFAETHGDAFYGCDSLKAIGEWFKQPARRYLAKYNAKVIVYEIPAGGYILPVGHGEVIFNRDKAHKVEELDILWDAAK